MEPDAIRLTDDMIAILEKLLSGRRVPRVAIMEREANTTEPGLDTGAPHA